MSRSYEDRMMSKMKTVLNIIEASEDEENEDSDHC